MFLNNLIQAGNIRQMSWTLLLTHWKNREGRLLPVFAGCPIEVGQGFCRHFQERDILHLFSRGFRGTIILATFLFLTAFKANGKANSNAFFFGPAPAETFWVEYVALVPAFSIAPSECSVLENNSASLNTPPTVDTIPSNEQEKHELAMLERMIRQLSRTVENMKHELYVTKTNGREDLQKAVEARENELNKVAQQLDQQSAQLEKNEVENFQVRKARQIREYETAVRQLNKEREKISKDTIQKIEKQMENQRMQLNRALWDLQLRRSDTEAKKGAISAEEYEMLEYELDQDERHLKETLQGKLDQQKLDFERELENAKMKLQFEEEQLELQKKQMDLNWKQRELQLADQREAILSEKRNLELQQKELAAQDIEKAQKKLDIQRKLAAEEIEMLGITLKILEKEWKERNK